MGLAASAGVFLALIVLPVLAILDRAAAAGFLPSLPGSRTVVLQALRLSAWTSACALLVIVALGTPCAYLLARHPFRGRALVDSLIELPLVLPPTVAGIGLLMAFGRRGLLGPYLESLGITLPFTAAAVVLAQVFVAGPFYIRAARAGFEAVAPHLELVARTLGVSDWQVFWRVTVPLAAPSLLSGLTMAWARALGEFGATIMFAGSFPGRTQTMTVAIYAELERDLDGALAMAAILLGVSFALLALLRLALGRGRAVA
ncbi:MAG: molybdate ABC transporter permease subunit [Firmicutes bacterium]|nr:molybdate ABC transporter permease subunit [Bacillota bacterium]